VPRQQIDNLVLTLTVGRRRSHLLVKAGARCLDDDAWEYCTRRIFHHPCDSRAGLLAERPSGLSSRPNDDETPATFLMPWFLLSSLIVLAERPRIRTNAVGLIGGARSSHDRKSAAVTRNAHVCARRRPQRPGRGRNRPITFMPRATRRVVDREVVVRVGDWLLAGIGVTLSADSLPSSATSRFLSHGSTEASGPPMLADVPRPASRAVQRPVRMNTASPTPPDTGLLFPGFEILE